MNLRSVLLLSTAAILLGSAGCKKEHDLNFAESPFYQKYGIEYNRTKDSTSVWAAFSLNDENGASVTMNNESTVKVNGVPGELSNSGYRVWALSGVEDVTIDFNKNGNDLQNRFRSSDMGEFSFGANIPDSISLSDTTYLIWEGTQLGIGEKMYLDIELDPIPIEGGTIGIGIDMTNGRNFTERYALQSLKPGNHKLILRKEKIVPVSSSDGTAGGTIQITSTIERKVVLYGTPFYP